jgi:hypothetical protein
MEFSTLHRNPTSNLKAVYAYGAMPRVYFFDLTGSSQSKPPSAIADNISCT